MKSQQTWAVLVVMGASAAFNVGCTAHARVGGSAGGEPTSPSSSSSESTGATSQAVTSGSSGSSSPSSASAKPGADKDRTAPPDHDDVPGVGNQRKADGTQPGTVGKGLKKGDKKKSVPPKKADKKKVVDKKADKKTAKRADKKKKKRS